MSSPELNQLKHELADLRLPHKLKQYRQLQQRIKSLTGQIDPSTIDALNNQLDNAVLCGVSQCFICGSANQNSLTPVRTISTIGTASSSSSAAAAATAASSSALSADPNQYRRSLSAQSGTVRHHPPVNTSGYLFNSQTSWHNGRPSSTGSSSPQPDSIDSECGSNLVNSAQTSDDEKTYENVDKYESDKKTIVNDLDSKSIQFEHEELENDSENGKQNAEEESKDDDRREIEENKVQETEEAKATAAPQQQPPSATTKPQTMERPITPCKSPINITSTNGRACKSPGPPVSPKPARKTVITTPAPASIVLGSNKGSYKAYKDFIANYSKVAKE